MSKRRSASGGILLLDSLYDFAREHRDAGDDALRLQGSAYRKEYSGQCGRIADEVDQVAGFYVWGRYDRRRYWHSIYLGKAGFRKNGTNLRERIFEELMDERAFAWCLVHHDAEIRAICQRIHNGKYTWKRPLRKAGATEIIWVPARVRLSDHQILRVEADLIEALNPSANLSRPIPRQVVQRDAAKVYARLREIIHENRPTKPSSLHRLVDKRLRASLC